MKFNTIIKNVFFVLLIVFSAFIFSLTFHLKSFFSSAYVEQLLYNLFNTTTLNLVSLKASYYKIFLLTVIISCISFLLLIFRFDYSINIFKKNIKIFPMNIMKYSIALFVISITLICIQVSVPKFIFNQVSKSNLYEKYYVPYKKENVFFENKKKNLIHIYVESLENSNFTINNGGIQKNSYMPKLEELALTYTNFSNSNKIGGFRNLHGTNWTIAGMVAQTAGVPIMIKTTNSNDKFLSGATAIGDILLDNGYSNCIMLGSNADFGERRKYFREHGSYEVFDYEYVRNSRILDYNYHEWWGFEDSKLFEFAKKKIIDINKAGKPFNFTMLTADTHFFDGYVDKSCKNKFSEHYANSFYCEDSMLAQFINWIQEQDFYDNTTIVITGDHLTMRNDFYKINNNYERTVFNLFINSASKTDNVKNRDFTAFDIYPTTLSSIGATIKDDKLGLGTNLFSDKKTLSEEIGYNKLFNEIQKKSNYYDKNILKK